MRAMARMLGRSASTISRELERNTPGATCPTPRPHLEPAPRGVAKPRVRHASSTCKA